MTVSRNAADFVSTSQLADLLLISPPAVNRMVNRLGDQGLLHHEPYQGIAITDQGRIAALRQIRVQRIAEVFLVQVMGISWLQAHGEALQLSNGLSDAVIARMYAMTGEPEFCPHGEPIPDEHGRILPFDDQPLSIIHAGQTVSVTRLTTREIDRLQYLEALGLVPNQRVEVIHVAPFEGPMQLKLGREYRIIGSNLAQMIRVRQMD